MSRRAALTAVCALAFAAVARADPPRHTTATAAGVRLTGYAIASSTHVPREPRYDLTNLTAAPQVVDLVSLVSLGEARDARALALRGPRRITLAPHETRPLQVAFDGRATNLGGALAYHRFALTVSVDRRRITAVASTAYMCRIPRRPDPP